MKAKLIDLTFTINRKQRLVLELDGDFRSNFDNLKDKDVRVEIKRYRKKRSLDANAYAWVLMDKISKVTGVNKVEVYRQTIKEIGGVSEVLCLRNEAVEKFRRNWASKGTGWQSEVMDSKIPECTNVVIYYGSSTYDTEQMSRLIDSVVQDAKALGIETMTPAELARIKSQWSEKK